MGLVILRPTDTGMDGNKLGLEIQVEVSTSLSRTALLPTGYFFGSYFGILLWQAIGRAIVKHIQDNLVVTVNVVDYYVETGSDLIPPGTVDGEFKSVKVE